MENKAKPVYIVDGARTPFLKAKGKRGPFSASDLAVGVGRDLLSRHSFLPTEFDEVILGCMMPSEDEANIARIVALRLGCGDAMPAFTVQRNCGTGMQALDCAMKDIQLGRANLVLAGGTECMSRAPLIFKPSMSDWLSDFYAAKTFGRKLSVMTKFRPSFLSPIIAIIRGLRDPLVGLNMGQTAEILADQFKISRAEMDEFAYSSMVCSARAFDEKLLNEIVTIYDNQGQFYNHDDGVRRDTTLEKLAKLKPIFDPKYGKVTAGNSSQITDGAAWLILASEEAVQKYQLPVLGKIVDTEWAALSPTVMGLGPVMASVPLLQRNHMGISDIDYWEINEAFAAQVLGCLRAMNDPAYCKEHFGLDKAFGKIDESKLNVDGGAIACGHPVGTSGARIVLHLLHVLKRNNAKRGVAALCIGGGQGGAMIIETV
jgi:acetyl-CoA C-acetyltransferase